MKKTHCNNMRNTKSSAMIYDIHLGYDFVLLAPIIPPPHTHTHTHTGRSYPLTYLTYLSDIPV